MHCGGGRGGGGADMIMSSLLCIHSTTQHIGSDVWFQITDRSIRWAKICEHCHKIKLFNAVGNNGL